MSQGVVPCSTCACSGSGRATAARSPPVDFAVIDARDTGHVLYREHVEIEQFKAEFDFWGSVIGLFEFVKGTLHGEGI